MIHTKQDQFENMEYFKHLKSIRLKIGGCFSSFLKAETVMENPRAVKPNLLLAGTCPRASEGEEPGRSLGLGSFEF